MKKFLAVIILCAVGPFAQADDIDGSIVLRDGSKTVRISVGDHVTNSVGTSKRIRRLERAVRDLQDRVYELEGDEQRVVATWICKVEGLKGTFYGEDVTRGRAERQAQESCQKRFHSMHCKFQSCTNE